MRLRRKHKLWLGVCVAAFVLGYFAVTYVRQELRMNSLDEENAALEAQLDLLKLQQATLEGDLENRSSDAYIERVAREELGFVKKGEIKFVEDESGAVTPVEPNDTAADAPEPDNGTASEPGDGTTTPDDGTNIQPETEPETGDQDT